MGRASISADRLRIGVPALFTQTHLRQRGWSPKLIETCLGDPDQTARNPVYPRKAPPMKLWDRARVEVAEKLPEFLAYQAKRAKASARSKAVAQRKRQELLSRVDAVDIQVTRWPLPKLYRAAISQWEQMGTERGEYGRWGADADDATKNRWAVNYVRHNLVRAGSGQRFPLLHGQTGISQAEALLEHKIYEAIAEVYPELASEAFHQAARLWGAPNERVWTTEVPSIAEGDLHASPAEGLATFQEKTRLLPATTEAERFIVQRIGQDVFREMLIRLWSGRCVITGLDQPELLRASHLKPWAECATDAERLDPYNGLLLSVHWDAAFDSGLVTLEDDGTLLFSDRLTSRARQLLLRDAQMPIRVNLHAAHLPYLRHQREHVWRH